MVSNEDIGAASLVLAKAIGERQQWLQANWTPPQLLVDRLTMVCECLYASIGPDELEALG